MSKDDFGNRMKAYESKERFMPLLPVIARLDGKGFSKFTKGLKRPYDKRLSDVMIKTTKFLVDQSNAKIGYTQSDEITLVFYSDSYDSQIFFDGKIQKMISVLSSIATAKFNQLIAKYIPEKSDKLPVFDCRVFQVPTKTEAANAVLWRCQDAFKNSVSMAAHHHFGHKATLNITGAEKQEMLFKEKGINFNDYPAFFKQGTFVRRELIDVDMDDETWDKIPDIHKPASRIVQRHRIVNVDMPVFGKVSNRVDVIFDSAAPQPHE